VTSAYSPDERSALRAHLTTERTRTADQVTALRDAFDGIVESSEEASVDDEHDPEGATIAFERAQVSALLDRALANLDILDRALDRLDGDGFGRCARCGRPIGFERLMALPTTGHCVRCAAETDDRSMLDA
jgi:RNA polymerase-binding transcription factor DksA